MTKSDPAAAAADERAVESQRWKELRRLEGWLEKPMLVLGLVWLVLLIFELTRGLNPVLETVGTAIWVVFIGEFALRLALAPRRGRFLKRNVLTILSLLAPALRVLRVLRVARYARLARYVRVARTTRGLRLLRVVGSINRGMRALGAAMSRRGFGYVLLLTVLVTVVGAAGMYAFERDPGGGRGLNNYGSALWWTAMLVTTMGSEFWPQTAEGRVLCLLLAVYAFAVFGYVTATIASFFIGRDADDARAEVAGQKSIDALHREVVELSRLVRQLSERPAASPPPDQR